MFQYSKVLTKFKVHKELDSANFRKNFKFILIFQVWRLTIYAYKLDFFASFFKIDLCLFKQVKRYYDFVNDKRILMFLR